MNLASSSLDALFRPRSVAVVGASSDPNKVGGRPIAFLRRAGFAGRILPVNPGADEVQGLRAWRSLAELSEPLDQMIVAVPAAQVMGVVEEAVARRVPAVQVFSAGFGEGTGQQAAREALSRALHGSATRVLGPNSLGLFNTADRFFGTFATALDGAWPRAGAIGVATQSGAFGSYFFGLAQRRGLAFSHFVATGSEWDVDVADCIDFLVQDAATQVIVMAIEGCRDGRKLARALQAAREAGKTVLAMKVGVSAAGSRAAATHTGALSGEDQVFDAVLRSAGAWRARSLRELVDAAYLASTGPLPGGPELLVVTTSGGIGVLAADAAESAGLDLPLLSTQALESVRQIAPLADGLNPVDTSAGILGDLSAYARIAERALMDRPYAAVLCFMAHIARNPAHWAQLRGPLFELRGRYPAVCFVACLLADAQVAADLEDAGFSVFEDPSAAVAALAACRFAAQARKLELQAFATPGAAPDRSLPPWPDRTLATEADARHALALLGVPFPPSREAATEEDLPAAAAGLGYPVVLKILSPDLAHKTEVGGVALNIEDESALRSAAAQMSERVRQQAPGARIEGFSVAPQISGGVEVLVGTGIDPVFGPVITVGAGGVLAEWHGDVAVGLAPLDEAAALRLIGQTRVDRLLKGWRGAPPLDRTALARLLVRLSLIADRDRERVLEIELNPVRVLPRDLWALDALVVPAARPATAAATAAHAAHAA